MTAGHDGHLTADEVRSMFDRIAPRYDLMNRVMTFGMDGRWRQAAAAAADVAAGDRVLDCCTGTGDLAFALAERVTSLGEVVATDFAPAMLERARRKPAPPGAEVRFELADITRLPYADDEFAAATVAFGVRNVPDLDAALTEMARVVRPGGRVVILEISAPPGLAATLSAWFERVVPLLGRLVGGDSAAYRYLPASARRFLAPTELAARMAQAGLHEISWRRYVGGLVALHRGRSSP